MTADRLAIDGGTPARSGPLTARHPFPDDAVTLATDAIRSGTLFRRRRPADLAIRDRGSGVRRSMRDRPHGRDPRRAARGLQLATEMRLFCDEGWDHADGGTRGYPRLGLNYRDSELAAAMALPQLSTLDDVLARRRHSATLLDAAVDKAFGVTRWQPLSGCDASYCCYPFSVPAGETTQRAEALAAEGVPTTPGLHRRTDLHMHGRTAGSRHVRREPLPAEPR
jgi:hypothetical protein